MTERRQPDAPAREGIGGWLLLLCRLLIVFHPLSLAVTASSVLNALIAFAVTQSKHEQAALPSSGISWAELAERYRRRAAQ